MNSCTNYTQYPQALRIFQEYQRLPTIRISVIYETKLSIQHLNTLDDHVNQFTQTDQTQFLIIDILLLREKMRQKNTKINLEDKKKHLGFSHNSSMNDENVSEI